MKKYNVPKVKESKRIKILTTIWLIPFIALIIALWLAYQYYTKIGSTIQISFKSNAGLIENQSPIKMLDVTVGIVTKINLSDDGQGVIVTARMNKDVSDYLNVKAKFWIVHPKVGSDGIYGLDTIVSGSYIELKGKKEKETMHNYIGLERQPIDNEAQGTYLVLSAPASYNIKERSRIYYRMLKVGRVERTAISSDGSRVNFTVFIEKEYMKYVNSKSKFYTRGAFNIDFSKSGFDVSLAPLSQLVKGGISIYTPQSSLDKNNTIQSGTTFYLYKNLAQMKAKQLGVGGKEQIYKLRFKEPTTKIKIGCPVEFKGFQVGEIIDIDDRYNDKTQDVQSDVYVLINIEAFTTKKLDENGIKEVIPNLIKRGLKAQLSNPVPVINSQYIELVFNGKEGVIGEENGYKTLPTISRKGEIGIVEQTKALLTKLQNLPLEDLLNSTNRLVKESRKPIKHLIKTVDRTVDNLNKTISNLNSFTSDEEFKDLSRTVNSTLRELEFTLQKLLDDYGRDSQFADQLSITLQRISEAAKSFDKTNKMLDRKANALVVGDE